MTQPPLIIPAFIREPKLILPWPNVRETYIDQLNVDSANWPNSYHNNARALWKYTLPEHCEDAFWNWEPKRIMFPHLRKGAPLPISFRRGHAMGLCNPYVRGTFGPPKWTANHPQSNVDTVANSMRGVLDIADWIMPECYLSAYVRRQPPSIQPHAAFAETQMTIRQAKSLDLDKPIVPFVSWRWSGEAAGVIPVLRSVLDALVVEDIDTFVIWEKTHIYGDTPPQAITNTMQGWYKDNGWEWTPPDAQE